MSILAMRKLIEAIKTKWNASPIIPALYYGVLPEKAALPACVFLIVSNVPQHGGMTSIPEGVLVQFSAFSKAKGVGECMDLRDAIRAAFDHVTLSISGAVLLRGDWQNEVGPTPDPDIGWDVHIDYRFLVEAT
jgi:hypothetical protein